MLKTFLISLKKNPFFKNILLVLSGTVLAQALGFITTPIITRLYLPFEFGALSIFMAIIGVLASFSSLRYEVAIPIERDDAKAHALIKLSLLIPIIISVLMILVFLFGGDYLLSKFRGLQKIQDLIWLIPLFFFITALFRVFSAWSLRDKAFKLVAKIKVVQSVSSSFVKILLGFFGFGVVGLLSGNFFQEVAGITGHVKKLKNSGFKFFSSTSLQDIKNVAIRYKRFPIYQSCSQLLLSIAQRLPIFFISYLYGFEVVGLYSFANSIISMPISVIGTSVSQVYFSEISEIGKEQSARLLSLSVYILKKLFLISIIPLVIVLFFGPQLFSMVFGDNWEAAGKIAQCVMVLIISRFISNPIMSYLNVIEKQQLQIKISLVRVVIIVLLFLLIKFYDLDILEAMLLYSIPMALFYLVVMMLVLSIMKKKA